MEEKPWQEVSAMTQETPIQTVELQLSALQTVNFALQHNKVPLIRNLTIINNTDASAQGKKKRVTKKKTTR